MSEWDLPMRTKVELDADEGEVPSTTGSNLLP